MRHISRLRHVKTKFRMTLICSKSVPFAIVRVPSVLGRRRSGSRQTNFRPGANAGIDPACRFRIRREIDPAIAGRSSLSSASRYDTSNCNLNSFFQLNGMTRLLSNYRRETTSPTAVRMGGVQKKNPCIRPDVFSFLFFFCHD
jgi:hypothetical protein